MALLFCDGFDHYSTITDKWYGVGTGGTYLGSYGRYGSNGLYFSQNDSGVISTQFASSSTMILGFAGSVGLHSSPIVFASFFDGTTSQVDLRMTVNRYLAVTRNGTSLGLGTIYIPAGWMYYEFKATFHDTTGAIEVRVNGVTHISLTNVNTRSSGNNYATAMRLHGVSASGAVTSYYDDLYLCNNSGSTNNDFLGDIRVQAILPSGAGNTTQMTPSAGNNYACVDETAPNGDTDYVSETTAGEKDTYAFGGLTPTSGTIKGVQVMINARKDDAGSRSIAPVYRPVSTDYDGTTVIVSDSYTYYREITEVSPATSAAWTIAEINGAEFGVKLIA